MYKLKIILSVFILNGIFAFTSSKANNNKKNWPLTKECVKLNDSAFEYIDKYRYGGNDKNLLITALTLLKKATKCDTTYIIAYSNMATVYDYMNNYDKEMEIANKLLFLTKNAPALLVKKGILFEKLNKIKSAKKIYLIAELEYEKKLSISPKNLGLIESIIILKVITHGVKDAKIALNKQIKLHPELSSSLNLQADFLVNFNRKDFVFGHTDW